MFGALDRIQPNHVRNKSRILSYAVKVTRGEAPKPPPAFETLSINPSISLIDKILTTIETGCYGYRAVQATFGRRWDPRRNRKSKTDVRPS